MWFYPADAPDYFFICQDCRHTQRVSGADITRVIWNFRACRSCQSTTLPFTLPISRSAGESGIQMADTPPQFLLRHPQGLPEIAVHRNALASLSNTDLEQQASFADLP